MVVEDDRAISNLIRHNLEHNGTQVVEVANGLDCIKMLKQSRIDLILLDLILPDFSGWGILSLLRLTKPLHDIPVIMVSVEPPDTALIKQLSPDDYIQKPFDIRDLVRRVQRVIDARNISRQSANKVA